MKLIGVTGFSGSGKSTFCQYLKALGVYVIDADEIGRNILKKGSSALKEVKDTFGEEYVFEDGELNRKKLGELVFNNKDELEKLNRITFHKIEEEIERQILNSDENVIAVDCALLCNMNIIHKFDEVVYIMCDIEILTERITVRDNISSETARNRIENQKTDFLKYATVIIENNKEAGILKEYAERIVKND